jgi:hypothetical protein
MFKLMDQSRQTARNRTDSVTTSQTIGISQTTIGPGITVEVSAGDVAESAASAIAKFFGGGGKTTPTKVAEPKPAGDKKTAAKPDVAKKTATDVEPDKKAKPDEKKPATPKKPEEEVNPQDQWLLDFYGGKGRAKWARKMIAPLEKMLKAADVKERMSAAIALVPLGKADEAIPIALAAVRENRQQMDAAGQMLPWLVWQERIKMFRDLCALTRDGESRSHVISMFGGVADRRAAEPLWNLLGDAKVSDGEANSLHTALMVTYLGEQYYSSSNISSVDRRDLAKAAKPRIESGNERQRLIALALLATAAKDDAAAAAAKLSEDKKLSDSLRTDAFQIELLTRSSPEARKISLSAMRGSSAGRKRLAVIYLIHGPGQLWSLHDGIYLYNLASSVESGGTPSGTPIVPKPPEGVTLEDVRPLLGDSNAEVAACAGYLAALLGDASGMEQLVHYWRRHGENSSDWRKLTYRAIASIDDPQYIPVLREVYGKLEEDEVTEFYWTIRIMSGPEILAFRKEIRDKIGTARLGQ